MDGQVRRESQEANQSRKRRIRKLLQPLQFLRLQPGGDEEAQDETFPELQRMLQGLRPQERA